MREGRRGEVEERSNEKEMMILPSSCPLKDCTVHPSPFLSSLHLSCPVPSQPVLSASLSTPILLISPPCSRHVLYTPAPWHLSLDPGSALLHPIHSTQCLTDSTMAEISTLLPVPHHWLCMMAGTSLPVEHP
jgi:hypothetical protein